jgi:3-hydroxyacyl-[acyl-carrier-protein] dehydratase
MCSYYAHKHHLLGKSKVVGFGGLEDVRFRDPVRVGDRLVIVCKMIKVRPGAIIVCRFQAFVGQVMVADGKIKGIPLPVDALTSTPEGSP